MTLEEIQAFPIGSIARLQASIDYWREKTDKATCKQCADTGRFWKTMRLFARELVNCDCSY